MADLEDDWELVPDERGRFNTTDAAGQHPQYHSVNPLEFISAPPPGATVATAQIDPNQLQGLSVTSASDDLNNQSLSGPGVSSPVQPLPSNYPAPQEGQPIPAGIPMEGGGYPAPPPNSFSHQNDAGSLPPSAGYYASEGQFMCNVAPFAVSVQDAEDAFRRWKKGLWFTPVTFLELVESSLLHAILIPHHLFHVDTQSVYSGHVVYHHHEHHQHTSAHVARRGGRNRPRVELNTTHHTRVVTRREPVSGAVSSQYRNVVACASTVSSDRKLLSHIDKWDLQAIVPMLVSPEHVGPSQDWSTTWGQTVQRKLLRDERRTASREAIATHAADGVECMNVSTNFTHISFSTVYLPMYFCSFSYEDKVYRFALNGQTGAMYGERPYGVSSLANAFKKILSLFSSEKAALLSGAELVANDKGADGAVYDIDSTYVVFPPSQSILGKESVGSITLRNTSSYPITLSSQRRNSAIFSATYTLGPMCTRSFDYRGAWVIKVEKQSEMDLLTSAYVEIVEVNPSKAGGQGDDLAMNDWKRLNSQLATAS